MCRPEGVYYMWLNCDKNMHSHLYQPPMIFTVLPIVPVLSNDRAWHLPDASQSCSYLTSNLSLATYSITHVAFSCAREYDVAVVQITVQPQKIETI